MDSTWEQLYENYLKTLYTDYHDLIIEEHSRRYNPHTVEAMAKMAMATIMGRGVYGRIEDGPVIYTASCGGGFGAPDSMCQVSINYEFNPNLDNPDSPQKRSLFPMRRRPSKTSKPNPIRALTVSGYAEARYLGRAYNQSRGYHSVSDEVFQAVVSAALRGCQVSPKYVETNLASGDTVALDRFKCLGEVREGPTHRASSSYSLEGPVYQEVTHYSVQNPYL